VLTIHLNRWTDRQTDRVILIYPKTLCLQGIIIRNVAVQQYLHFLRFTICLLNTCTTTQ